MFETRGWPLSMALVALSLLLLGCGAQDASKQASATTYIHFFVAPKVMPDGTAADKEIDALRVWLADLSGGYTEFTDAPGGWLDDDKNLQRQAQVAFFVSDAANLKAQIRAYLKKAFQQEDPYIDVWTALD